MTEARAGPLPAEELGIGDAEEEAGGEADQPASVSPEERKFRRARSNKTWVFDAGDPLTCMATCSVHPLIAVAGRNLLHVLRIEEDDFVPIQRAKNFHRTSTNKMPSVNASTTRSTTSASVSQVPSSRSYGITDVAWSDTPHTLATCSNAGDLVIWDLSRGITQSSCFTGHARSIHRIHFNPNAPNEIILASHDGTVKLFDIRDQSCRRSFQLRTSAPSPVRDAVYCPHESHILAGAFENGLVSIWDTRNDVKPARCFQGHTGVTASIDWHPNWNSTDRNWLATAGGRDNTLKVWDLNDNSPTAIYSLRSKATGHVRWRVGEATQLISCCSLALDLSIHLWELNRPYIPYITFGGHAQSISGIAWSHDRNAFYSVARDGRLLRHHIEDGIQTVRDANPVALSFNCRGTLAHAVGGETALRMMAVAAESAAESGRTASVATATDQGAASLLPRLLGDAPTRTPQQLLVTRRSLQLPLSIRVPLIDDNEVFWSSSTGTPSNVIPPDVFVAQGCSELFEATFVLERRDELEGPVSALLTPHVFVHLAKNYRIAGNSVAEVCDHNLSVAQQVHQDVLAQFWLNLKMLFTPPSMPASESTGKVRITTASGMDTSSSDADAQSRGESSPPPGSRVGGPPTADGVCVLDFLCSRETVVDFENGEKICFEPDTVGGKSDAKESSKGLSEASSTKMKKSGHPIRQVGVDTGRSVNFLFDSGGFDGASESEAGNGNGDDDEDDDEDGEEPEGKKKMTVSGIDVSPEFDNRGISPQTGIELDRIPVDVDVEARSFLIDRTDLRQTTWTCDRRTGAQSPTKEACGSRVTRVGNEDDAIRLQQSVPTPSPMGTSQCLDLTSTTDCLEPLNTALLETFKSPLDFTHLVGPWFLELIDAGHAQTVCTALVALGTERTRINNWVTEKQIETWLYSYIDVLDRFRLWSASTRILKFCGGLQGGIVEKRVGGGVSNSTPPPGDFKGRRSSKEQQLIIPRRARKSLQSKSGPLPLAPNLAALNQTGTSLSVRCGKCSKPMQCTSSISTPAPTTTQSSSGGPVISPQATTPSPMTSFHAAWACPRHTGAETSLSTCAVCHMTVRGVYLWCIGCSHGGHMDHIMEWMSRRRVCPSGCGHYCEYGKLDANLYLQITA